MRRPSPHVEGRPETRHAVLAICVALLAGAAWAAGSPPAPATVGDPGGARGDGSDAKRAIVRGVTDGDTIKIRRRDRNEDVRLIGIDTPEVYPSAECGGERATAAMRRTLSVGSRVRLIRDPSQDNRDAYGRLLRYVERRGRDVGRKQIRRGWAKVDASEPPFARAPDYRRAQRRARDDDRGVWRRCDGDFHLTP